MSDMQTPNTPYKTLGTHLKYLREQSNESIAEVSGAVEIDENALHRIEDGLERPAEDILLLLLTHFDMQDHEAVQIWELAGYDGSPESFREPAEDAAHNAQKAVVMFLALDSRTMYSDGLQVSYNQAGITLNFTQETGTNQRNVVSRVGMSYDQAEQVLHSLQSTILKAKYTRGPKQLPPTSSASDVS